MQGINKQYGMTQETKNKWQVGTAAGMLTGGLGLTVAGFIVPPLGEISNSVLWVLGQCLIYAGSIFGVSTYMDNKFMDIKRRLRLKEGEEEPIER